MEQIIEAVVDQTGSAEESPLVYEKGILIFNGKVDDDVAENWLAIINSQRERPLFQCENKE